ncbi:MAG: zinc ribbon domain-containing protein [Lachnospiraceae bacterium]|nr:zinc ribbon domain-containing protein [Lachnospiraceae bacterium]
MNCRFCGAPLEEGARFCSNCGAKTDSAAPASSQNDPEPAVSPAQSQPASAASYASRPQEPLPLTESPVWRALRSALSSPLFLLLALLLTCELASMVYSGFTGARAADPNANNVILLLSTLTAALPLLLYTVGTWLMWGSSKGEDRLKGPGAVRAASVIMIVLISIAVAFYAIVLIPIIQLWSEGRLAELKSSQEIKDLLKLFDGSLGLFLFVIGLSLLMLILVLLYFAKMASLARTIREADETGLLRRRIPSYLNFVHGLMILTVLGSLIVVFTASGGLKKYLEKYGLASGVSLLTVLQTAVGIALPLVLFLCIRKLKTELKKAV